MVGASSPVESEESSEKPSKSGSTSEDGASAPEHGPGGRRMCSGTAMRSPAPFARAVSVEAMGSLRCIREPKRNGSSTGPSPLRVTVYGRAFLNGLIFFKVCYRVCRLDRGNGGGADKTFTFRKARVRAGSRLRGGRNSLKEIKSKKISPGRRDTNWRSTWRRNKKVRKNCARCSDTHRTGKQMERRTITDDG